MMRIVIAGAGSVGRHMAAQLSSAGHAITLVERNRAVVAQRRTQPDLATVDWVCGDICDLGVLGSCGLREADVLTAVTGDDEDNLVAALLAKQEFGVPKVVARVNNPRNEWLFGDLWGVDISVSTPHLLTSLVEEAVTVGSLVRLLALQQGRANLLEVTLATDSPAAGKSIAALGLPREAAVVAVIRSGQVLVPDQGVVFLPGDEAVVLSSSSAGSQEQVDLAELQRIFVRS